MAVQRKPHRRNGSCYSPSKSARPRKESPCRSASSDKTDALPTTCSTSMSMASSWRKRMVARSLVQPLCLRVDECGRKTVGQRSSCGEMVFILDAERDLRSSGLMWRLSAPAGHSTNCPLGTPIGPSPELAVEIISPGNSMNDMMHARRYFRHGSRKSGWSCRKTAAFMFTGWSAHPGASDGIDAMFQTVYRSPVLLIAVKSS